MSAKFATGKYAYGICDVCGVSYRYCELRGTTIRGRRTGILACPTCWDPDHPQNFLPEALVVDAIAIRNPRPEDYIPSRRMRLRLVEPGGLIGTLSVGEVEVTT